MSGGGVVQLHYAQIGDGFLLTQTESAGIAVNPADHCLMQLQFDQHPGLGRLGAGGQGAIDNCRDLHRYGAGQSQQQRQLFVGVAARDGEN